MKLTGECNLCGACCFTKYGAICENLEVLARQGLPNATRCRIYAQRYDRLADTNDRQRRKNLKRVLLREKLAGRSEDDHRDGY